MNQHDPGLVGAGLLLLLMGVPIAMLGALLVPTGYLIGTTEPQFVGLADGWILGLMIGVGEGILVGGWGVMLSITGLGLAVGRVWAWRLAVPVLALMILTICCAPIAGPALYLAIRESSRRSLGMK